MIINIIYLIRRLFFKPRDIVFGLSNRLVSLKKTSPERFKMLFQEYELFLAWYLETNPKMGLCIAIQAYDEQLITRYEKTLLAAYQFDALTRYAAATKRGVTYPFGSQKLYNFETMKGLAVTNPHRRHFIDLMRADIQRRLKS